METGIVKIKMDNLHYAMHNNSGLDYYLAYNELIDNAIDNNATEITIEHNHKSVIVSDNGTGIKDTQEDIERVLRMYRSSNERDELKIGEYGVGLKEATMRLGKGIFIKSKAPGCRSIEIDVPWKTLDFEQGLKVVYKENKKEQQGTRITIFFDESDRKPPPPPGKTSFKYYENLIKNKKLKLILNDNEYTYQSEPQFETPPQIITGINFDGKKFDLKIGILIKSLISLSGFYVYSTETNRYYQYADANLGNTIDAKDGLYVSIGLYGTKIDWPVDKNKRGILNIDIVAKYLDTNRILFNWKQKLYNSKTTEICNEVARMLAPYFGLKGTNVGEEKRNKQNINKGTVKPVYSEKKRLFAERIAEHERKKVVQKYGYGITHMNIVDTDTLAEDKYLSISKGGEHELTIYMNKNNKFINKLITGKTINTKEVLLHFITIAYKTNCLDPAKTYTDYVTELFTQHEAFNKIGE